MLGILPLRSMPQILSGGSFQMNNKENRNQNQQNQNQQSRNQNQNQQ